MRKLLNYIKSLFIETNWEEKYLSQSVDHYDLERRQRALNNGTITVGPYGRRQKYYH